MTPMTDQIAHALGNGVATSVSVRHTGRAELPSCFPVTDLAVASFQSAAAELAAFVGAREVSLDRRLAALWFDRTLHPIDWPLPSVWDVIAGNYRTSDGWIRLHTNAPHHRDAALGVLGCAADKAEVAAQALTWRKTALEEAVVAAGGAAAAMHSLAHWAQHPQGQAVAQEPLIAWQDSGGTAPAVTMDKVKVLDLTRVLAGPVATRFLAGYGAQVLRIDPPWWTEPGVEPEVTLGKTRAGLDLTRAADRQTFEGLLASADVFVHGYRPGALAGLGYDAARLRALAPKMIDVSLCAYGWTGPWAGRRGFDSLVQMSCGIADEGMQRMAADHPVPLPVQALDHATGYLMAAAILRALRLRHDSGRVMTARLSLARTASLLMSQGAHDMAGVGIDATDADLSQAVELTGWGAARRVEFPMRMDGQPPLWPRSAGPLRMDAARW